MADRSQTKGGVLEIRVLDRLRFLAACVITLAALPLLVAERRGEPTDGVPALAAVAPAAGVRAPGRLTLARATTSVVDPGPTSLVSGTPVSPAPAVTSDASAHEPPAAAARAGSAAAVRPSTSGTPVSEPMTDPGPPANSEEGKATFLSYDPARFGVRPCAHQTLPVDTVVTVTNLNNGKTTTCVVRDRALAAPGRIIELDVEQFQELADPAVGVVPVRLSW
jgi:hypothetical protein